MARQKSTTGPGIAVLASKFGVKLMPFALKLLKGIKALKIALAAISITSYSLLFTWQFAVMIMVMLFVHENGHIWAMRRYGMKVKGIYFIPFLGGLAVGETAFPSRKAEVIIAIMGPIWGFALALATGVVYFLTNNPLFAAASSWMAFINLFNLLPINPFDGGRIMKNVAFSLHSWVGMIFVTAGFVVSILLAVKFGLWLVVFMGILGLVEALHEHFFVKNYRGSMTRKMIGASVVSYLAVAVILFALMYAMNNEPGAALALQTLES